MEFGIKNKKLIWKKIKHIFCQPQEQDLLQFKLKQKEYSNLLIILLLVYVVFFIPTLLDSMRMKSMLLILITAILLYLLRVGMITFLKILLVVTPEIYIYFWIIFYQGYEFTLAGQVILAFLPSYCLVLTQSLPLSGFLFIINLMESLYLYQDKFTFFASDSKKEIYTNLITVCYGCGFILLGVIWFLLKSNQNLLIRTHKHRNDFDIIIKQLTESKKAGEEKLKDQHSFFLQISHEVRNPLNIIHGSTEIALLHNTNDDIKNFLETIQTTTDIIKFLINHLLDSEKLINNGLEFCRAPIKTLDFMEKLWNTNKILIRKKRLHGMMFISKNLPDEIKIDKMRTLQIVYNLVGNAVKFTSQGYVSIVCTWINSIDNKILQPTEEEFFRQYLSNKKSLTNVNSNSLISKHSLNDHRLPIRRQTLGTLGETAENSNFYKFFPSSSRAIKTFRYNELFSMYHKLEESHSLIPSNKKSLRTDNKTNNNGYLKIEVIDSGCGINKNGLNNLFQKFSQVGSDAQNRLGSGLGLWISKDLCVKMGGDLFSYSKLNEGSVFVAVIECPSI